MRRKACCCRCVSLPESFAVWLLLCVVFVLLARPGVLSGKFVLCCAVGAAPLAGRLFSGDIP